MISIIIISIICYLIGSIPGGLVVGKLHSNTDIRTSGSKNLGTTNAIRVLGKVGLYAFVIDFLKGIIPIVIITLLNNNNIINLNFAPYYFAIFIIIGHCWPIFADFKGGKAVATSLGVYFVIDYRIALIIFAVFGIMLLFSKMVSLSSTVGTVSGLILIIIMQHNIYTSIMMAIITFIIMYRHRANYYRIARGEESKIGSKHKNK